MATVNYEERFNLNWDNAKVGTFTQEERETLVCSNMDGTFICTSEKSIITRICKLYHDKLEIKVLYYTETNNSGKMPTEIRVHIPKLKYFGLRSLKDGEESDFIEEESEDLKCTKRKRKRLKR